MEEEVTTFISEYNALISYFLHIPFPEALDDEAWIEKARQVYWLEDKNILGIKFIKK